MNSSEIKALGKQAFFNEPVFDDIRFPPSPYYRFLKLLAQTVRPNLSVELGVAGGGGSLHLAMGYPQGQVIGIDITNSHPDNIKFIEENYPNYIFVIGDSVEVAEKIYNRYGKVDILFIDTPYYYEQTTKELEVWIPYLSDNAIVCLDDILAWETKNLWEEVLQIAEGVRLDYLHQEAINAGGFGVFFNIKK